MSPYPAPGRPDFHLLALANNPASCISLVQVNPADGSPYLLRALKGHTDRVQCVAFSTWEPDVVASGSDDRTARIWSVKEGRCLVELKVRRLG